MATPKKVPVKSITKPTKKQVQSKAKTTKTLKSKAPKKVKSTTPCTCCPNCAGADDGTIGSCESGGCVDINPPTVFSILMFDPARPVKLPYWDKPSNIPAAALSALATALAPYLPSSGGA